MAGLADMPPPERNAFIAFYGRWLSLPKDRRAVVAKTLWPHLKDGDIATLAGVDRRTLSRWETYRQCKATVADFTKLKRTPSKRRASNRGGWWELDNPEAGS